MKKKKFLFFLLFLLFTNRLFAEKINFLFEISGKKGDNINEFDNIQGVASDKYGNIYIADSDNHRIKIFDN
ncbi:hypothetical protein HY745_13315, partial [Candidatus Desantisbacteria bacterium]|nr:hypothetical protein [Candidatus Desantisbacteria bacterium]